MKGSAYPGSSGRSVDMIAIDPWPSLEQKCQEKNESSFTVPVGPKVCPEAKAGKLQGGRWMWMWCGFILQTARCSSPGSLAGWYCIPFSPLPDGSWEGCGKYCLPEQVALGSRREILVLRSYSLCLTSQAAVCNLSTTASAIAVALAVRLTVSDVVCIIRF